MKEGAEGKKEEGSGGKGRLAEFEERMGLLKKKVIEMKKKGEDTSLIEIRIVSLESDINVARLTKDDGQLKRVEDKIKRMENELS